MNKKRILIFSLVYYPRFIGGAEVAIKEITDRLSPEEYEFDMVTLRLDKRLPKVEKIGNVTIYRVGFAGNVKSSADSLKFPWQLNKYLLALTGYRKAAELHTKHHYDAIWSMMATYNSFAALFFKLRFPRVPFILTLQEGDPIDYIKSRVGIFYPIFKQIFIKADLIQTISNYLSGFARETGYTGRIEMIPNGVTVDAFTREYPTAELNALREKLGKKSGDVFLITTSRLVVKNAVGDVIESLRFLPSNVKFLILGVGYQEAELKQLAKDKGLTDRVIFLGYVPHSEMPKYLKVSDIFIRPSLSEGFGNSFIEAMAAGIPVIGTLEGGIKDFLVDGVTGLAVPTKSPKAIAFQVQKYLNDRVLRDKITINGKRMAFEKYDWDLIAEEMRSRVLAI